MKHQSRKRFGQNFLHDHAIIDRIIAAIHPYKTDHIIEIGPGLGALTEPLLAAVRKLDAIELDRDLVPKLKAAFMPFGNFTIHQADALKFDLHTFHEKNLRVVGNLPYNISTPLLFHLMTQVDLIQDMVFMLQKEVVDRICAKVGSKYYGRLSVMLQFYCDVEKLFEVPPEAFDPPPKVDSAIVRLAPKEDRPKIDLKKFEALIQKSFAQRRKTIKNNLKNIANEIQLAQANINPTSRPQEISVEQYLKLLLTIDQ